MAVRKKATKKKATKRKAQRKRTVSSGTIWIEHADDGYYLHYAEPRWAGTNWENTVNDDGESICTEFITASGIEIKMGECAEISWCVEDVLEGGKLCPSCGYNLENG